MNAASQDTPSKDYFLWTTLQVRAASASSSEYAARSRSSAQYTVPRVSTTTYSSSQVATGAIASPSTSPQQQNVNSLLQAMEASDWLNALATVWPMCDTTIRENSFGIAALSVRAVCVSCLFVRHLTWQECIRLCTTRSTCLSSSKTPCYLASSLSTSQSRFQLPMAPSCSPTPTSSATMALPTCFGMCWSVFPLLCPVGGGPVGGAGFVL